MVASAAALAVPRVAPAAAEPQPFGHPCTPAGSVRLCATTALTRRVLTFDRTPLDADVTLPASGDGPFPTLVLLHGFGGDKDDPYEADPANDGGTPADFAQRGYAVLTYSARGYGDSCGTAASRAARALPRGASCRRGWTHVADQRYEVRDTQHLLGLLVDEGLAAPKALGVIGTTYGAGQALQLAAMRDRLRLTSNALTMWRSPRRRVKLSLAAVWARFGWSDLSAALVPNGRVLDSGPITQNQALRPIGIPVRSALGALVRLQRDGVYTGPNLLARWSRDLIGVEPFGAAAARDLREMSVFHSPVNLLRSAIGPAPLLIEGGFTDGLFPAAESVRAYEAARARGRGARAAVALQLGDVGTLADAKPADQARFNRQALAFLDARLHPARASRPAVPAPARGSVTALRLTCPRGASSGAPFTARSWAALHPRRLVTRSARGGSVLWEGGTPDTGLAIDPFRTGNPCRFLSTETAAGTFVVSGRRLSRAFTVLGRPAVTLRVAAVARGPAGLDARLWDVSPDAEQLMIARGALRLSGTGAQTARFELGAAAYTFARGHTLKLELAGNGTPYYQAPRRRFEVRVSGATLSVPGR